MRYSLNDWLIAGILAEILLAGALAIGAWTTGLLMETHWKREAHAIRFEFNSCKQRHNALLDRIKGEKLWGRLGMPGSPWLQEVSK